MKVALHGNILCALQETLPRIDYWWIDDECNTDRCVDDGWMGARLEASMDTWRYTYELMDGGIDGSMDGWIMNRGRP